MNSDRGIKRLLVAVLTAWIAYWGWQFASAKYVSYQSQRHINEVMLEIEALQSNYSTEEFERLDSITREEMDVRDGSDKDSRNAMRVGLLGGLFLLLLSGLSLWIWRGFRKPE